MDPLTLFALANGAVAAVKKGCQLYKDIKGAAGDIKSVLKDLDEQFHANHPPDKPATVTQRNAYIEEKNRVIELNKRGGETTGIYTEIGDYLGQYYDNMYKCMAVFEEEERRSKEEIYEGDASLGKRALQRVLMKKQLEQMGLELRELMIYQSPPELGALYTDVEEMMKEMGKEQKVLIMRQMEKDRIVALRRRKRMERLWADAIWGVAALTISISIGMMIVYIIHDRIEKYPQLGTDWIPKSEEHRRRDAEPKHYIGR